MRSGPRPLAVGLLHVPAHITEAQRRKARIDLAVRTTDEGYALVETYETDGSGLKDEVALRGLEDMAERLGVRVVVAAGQVNGGWVREVARRGWMIVLDSRETAEKDRRATRSNRSSSTCPKDLGSP